MKTVVLDRDVLEVEVRPQAELDEYRRLLAEEVSALIEGGWTLRETACPGCRGAEAEEAFARYGLTYMLCRNCSSLYASPRPAEGDLSDFYRSSQAARYWRETLLPLTREARRAKLFRPRAEWLLDVVDEFRPNARKGVAVGYHNDLLVEELCQQESQLFDILVANPAADIEFAGVELPRVEIRPMPLDDLAGLGAADVFLAFDILDRCADLETLVAGARAALEPGGLLLGTTTLGSGFDIQVLWDRAEGVYPPERINLLSEKGLTALWERHGFEVLEFSTPGVFDVETVRHAIEADPEGGWPRFMRYLVENGDEGALEALQEYLQRFRLSSFARVVLRKT